MKTSLKLLAFLLLLSSVALAKNALKRHVVKLQGLTASISLPNDFVSDTTKSSSRSAMFSAASWSSNCLVATLGEKITKAELSSAKTLEGIKLRVDKKKGRIVESGMTTVANRPTLRVLVAVPRSSTMMIQERYIISGDPGSVVMFTTTETRSKEILAKSKQWIRSLQFGG